MIAEDKAALRILMNDDLYLILSDLVSTETLQTEIKTEPALPEQPAIPEIIFQGKNIQNFLILTNEPIAENHLKALESTLLRKQLTLDDVALVDLSALNPIAFEQLNTSFMPQKLVLFGLSPELINLPKQEMNRITTFSNCQILYTYSFDEMLGNKEKTKAFWEPMKMI